MEGNESLPVELLNGEGVLSCGCDEGAKGCVPTDWFEIVCVISGMPVGEALSDNADLLVATLFGSK